MTDHKGENNPNYKHGLRKTRLYRIWGNAKSRCNNKKTPLYKHYGGRGILMCNEWNESFQAFYDWAVTSGYRDGLTLDRINNDGNYCPENCRWATMSEQTRNRRSNRTIEFRGETKTITDWAKAIGISAGTLFSRLNNAWSVEKALTTPTDYSKSRTFKVTKNK